MVGVVIMRHFGAFALAALLFTAVGCSSGPAPAPVVPITPADSPNAPNSIYRIGPGDNLQIFVYGSPELSVAGTPVRPDGRLALPLVPDIQAAGKTPTELAHDIAELLKKYVQDPNVSVIVHSFNSTFDRQIKVVGEAAQPIALPYSDHMTLLDVMIMTHGVTKFAAGNSAVVVRHVGDHQETIHVRLADLLKDGDVTQNIEMQPGDTLIIPQSYF